MKVTLSHIGNEEPVDVNYNGLAVDTDGDVWILTNSSAAICLVDPVFSVCDDMLKNYGPFTPYHGQIVLEN